MNRKIDILMCKTEIEILKFKNIKYEILKIIEFNSRMKITVKRISEVEDKK